MSTYIRMYVCTVDLIYSNPHETLIVWIAKIARITKIIQLLQQSKDEHSI